MKSITSRENRWFKRVRDAVTEGRKGGADAVAAGGQPIAVLEFSKELRRAVGDTKTSQGVFGLFERPPSRFANDKLVAALDGVQDPGNVGTIVRLAAAFDAGVALLPGCADPFSPKAIRASAGAILSVPIASVTAQQLIDAGRPLLYADARGAAAAPPRDAILVLGSEGRGVSEEIREHGKPIAIETTGRVESLNVAAAAAILLWQAFRF